MLEEGLRLVQPLSVMRQVSGLLPSPLRAGGKVMAADVSGHPSFMTKPSVLPAPGVMHVDLK